MIVKQYVFTETPEFRPPKTGEWFLLDDAPVKAAWGGPNVEYPILAREVHEVEIPDPVPAWIKEAADDIWAILAFHDRATLATAIAQYYRAAKAEGKLDDI